MFLTSPLYIERCRTADTVDFDLSQLDTKKKIRPKLGEGILLRLRFVQSAAQLTAAGGSTGKGYELVTSDEGDNEGAGDVELGRAVATSEEPAESANAAGGSAARSESASGKSDPTKVSPMNTATTPTGSTKSKKTEAAFTSLVTGTKSPEDTTVAL